MSGNGFRFFHGSAELRRAGSNGGKKRHGETIIYLDGRPVSLQRVAAESGIRVDILSQRAKAARDRGQGITMEWLTRPIEPRAPRKA